MSQELMGYHANTGNPIIIVKFSEAITIQIAKKRRIQESNLKLTSFTISILLRFTSFKQANNYFIMLNFGLPVLSPVSTQSSQRTPG